ncbi:hypothetical protein CLOP_g20853 [Closterium sp. NIES-67]|nr:hypothetical protein CLOP_g20853 [Closterium sp. NIES-67]
MSDRRWARGLLVPSTSAPASPSRQRAPNGPSGRAGTRRGRRGSALERRLARTAATLEGILERAGAGLLPSPLQREPPHQAPHHTQPPFPPRVLPPICRLQTRIFSCTPPRTRRPRTLRSCPPPGYYDLHHRSQPAPQIGGPASSVDTLPEWHPPSSWAGAAEWAGPQGPPAAAPAEIPVPAATLRRLGHARRGTEILMTILAAASSALGSSGGRSMAPYFPLQGCMEAAIDLAVEAARARPGPARGTGTDPHLLAALRQVSASLDSASAAGLVAGAVSTLQVLLSYQAALLEEAGLAAVAE